MNRISVAVMVLGVLVVTACRSSAGGREVAIAIGPDACSPGTVAVTPGESISFTVKNDAGADRELEGIEGTQIEEVLVPDGRARTINYTVPDASNATYRVKCYSPSGPTTIIELVAGSGGGADTAAPVSASIDVDLAEWSVTPSAASAPAAAIRFVAHNRSDSLTHELAVIKVGPNGEKFEIAEVAGLAPGTDGEVIANLEPGSYQLACLLTAGEDGSTVDHYASGMHAEFTVE